MFRYYFLYGFASFYRFHLIADTSSFLYTANGQCMYNIPHRFLEILVLMTLIVSRDVILYRHMKCLSLCFIKYSPHWKRLRIKFVDVMTSVFYIMWKLCTVTVFEEIDWYELHIKFRCLGATVTNQNWVREKLSADSVRWIRRKRGGIRTRR